MNITVFSASLTVSRAQALLE